MWLRQLGKRCWPWIATLPWTVGCPRADGSHEQLGAVPSDPSAASTASTAPLAAKPTATPWRDLLGQCVVVEGHLTGTKLGPELSNPAYRIAVSPADDAGTAGLVGGHVRVEGVVAERSDRPVFVPKKGEPMMQGIPVPEGTDLEQARKRFVIDGASTKRLRSPAEVEAALRDRLGSVVTLTGVLWSLNGHWWFRHDGVDIHVEGLSNQPGWSADRHGQPVAVRGTLGRKPLPRIDQIALKADRDLAEAYFLDDPVLKPHPAWPLRACADSPRR